MDDLSSFGKLVPGFEFLQNLVKGAGAAIPHVGQWVAPTLDPAELDKRIQELRTVQFWLEQNARMLATTIQALEVQRMTLSTLQTMNVSLGDLTESLKIKLPEGPAPVPAAAPAAAPAPAPPPKPERPPRPVAEAESAAAAGIIDPMKWWGALTRQFTELAANAINDGSADAARSLAGAMMQQGIAAAGKTMQAAAAMPAAAAKSAKAGAETASPARRAAGGEKRAAARRSAKPAPR